jgi:hypothetical protein
MEKIITFKKSDYTYDGIHIPSGKFIMEQQADWEAAFHEQFNPYYANVIEGHPSAMLRLTKYMAAEDDDENTDFGMDLIDGEIDIDTNLAIEKYSNVQTVYAIGSQFHDDEDNPLFLIKNDKLAENILVLKYVSDDENGDMSENIPVLDKLFVKT